MPNSITYYQREFGTLQIDRTHGEPAPSKPILLLAVIDLIEQGAITQNKICPSPLLVETFFKELAFGRSENPRIQCPFRYLKSERFWHLEIKVGQHEKLSGRREFGSLSPLSLIKQNNRDRRPKCSAIS